jgi:hypothetical protein
VRSLIVASRAIFLLAAVLVLAGPGCSEEESVFQTTGSLRVDLRDRDLATQSTSGSVQMMRWVLESVTATVSGVPEPFDFLGIEPCTYTDHVFFRGDMASQCFGSGLIIGTDAPTTATFHLTVSRMEMHRASQPDLPDLGDYDGDGVLNGDDNCRIVPNPAQDDVNGDGAGDICELVDSTANLVPDQDLDGVRDSSDNCFLVANPPDSTGFQPDSDGDFIGDACDRVVPVVIPGGTLKIDCPAAPFDAADSQVATFFVKFDHETVLSCPDTFSSCVLDPTELAGFWSNADPDAGLPCVVVP